MKKLILIALLLVCGFSYTQNGTGIPTPHRNGSSFPNATEVTSADTIPIFFGSDHKLQKYITRANFLNGIGGFDHQLTQDLITNGNYILTGDNGSSLILGSDSQIQFRTDHYGTGQGQFNFVDNTDRVIQAYSAGTGFGANVFFGENDINHGNLSLYGNNSTSGGGFFLYNPANYDTEIDRYFTGTINGNYIIQGNNGTSGSAVPAFGIDATDLSVTFGNYSFPRVDGSAGQVLKTDGSGDLTWQDESGGGAPNSSLTFTGAIDLSNTFGNYYDTYDLAVSGTPTYSVSSATLGGTAYIVIDSDGTTPFATKLNLDAVFDEQYGLPQTYILPEGLNRLYIHKATSSKAAISIPTNLYNPDLTAPQVTSATIEDAARDELVVVFTEAVDYTDATGLSLSDDFSAFGISSLISGDETNTLTFQLYTSAAQGEAGNFVYSVSNTITDLAGNSLASGTTSITNNSIDTETLTFTTTNLTESSNVFEKTGGSNWNTSYGISDQSFTGAFTFTVDLTDADALRTRIGVSLDGTLRASDDVTTPIEYGWFDNSGNPRVLINGSGSTSYTGTTITYTGETFSIVRDGSNNVYGYYNGVQIHSFGTLVGPVYLYIDQGGLNGDFIYNPRITLD